MTTIAQQSPKVAVFYVIRYHDIELAEVFRHRCPDHVDLKDLNAFFHQTLAQYEFDTSELRAGLDPIRSFELWIQWFENNVLPVLRANRFPALSAKEVTGIYR